MDIKSRKIDVWLGRPASAELGVVKCKGPGARLEGRACSSPPDPVLKGPLEYGDVSALIPDTSALGQLLCPLCLVYCTGQG